MPPAVFVLLIAKGGIAYAFGSQEDIALRIGRDGPRLVMRATAAAEDPFADRLRGGVEARAKRTSGSFMIRWSTDTGSEVTNRHPSGKNS